MNTGLIIALLGLMGIIVSCLIVLIFIQNRNKTGMNVSDIIKELEGEISKASLNALSRQNELGGKDLDEKKKLIDQRLDEMKSGLNKMEVALNNFNKQSGEKMSDVGARLDETTKVINQLRNGTSKLNEILCDSRKRGSWGERTAKQILDMVGMKEGIDYHQQKATAEGKPDFTFHLPNGLKVNLDSKFPLDKFAAYVQSGSEADKEVLKKDFLADARDMMKTLSKKDYVDPEGGTVDYSIMFIANEQVFNFINEYAPSFMDDAMKMKVVVCSPFTLFAVISVIHKAVENFKMEKASREMLGSMGKFNEQWEAFKRQFDDVGKAITKAKDEFDTLTTTRVNKLEVPLRDIERIREAITLPKNTQEESGDISGAGTAT